jgi:hypothetical protein
VRIIFRGNPRGILQWGRIFKNNPRGKQMGEKGKIEENLKFLFLLGLGEIFAPMVKPLSLYSVFPLGCFFQICTNAEMALGFL